MVERKAGGARERWTRAGLRGGLLLIPPLLLLPLGCGPSSGQQPPPETPREVAGGGEAPAQSPPEAPAPPAAPPVELRVSELTVDPDKVVRIKGVISSIVGNE